MKTQSFHAAVRFLAAVFLCGAAWSQAAEREPQAEAAGSLSSSIAVSRDRDIATRFANVREALDQQNYASGLGLLQTLLESNHADFVPIEPDPRDLTRERYASVSRAARRLLMSLPAEALQLYEQQTGPTAWNEFEAASRRGDLEAVRRVGARFPLTRAELSALKFVVASGLGSGRPQLAATGAWQLLQHPLLEQRDRSRVELQLKAALRALELAKTGTHNNTTQDVVQPWRVGGLIAADDATLLSEAFQEHESHSIDILPRGKPLIRGDVLCVRSLRHVSAYDISSGRELWTSRKATDDAPVMTSNLSLRDLVARSLGKQVQSDSVLAGLNADAEIVVTVEAVQPRLVVLPSEPVVSGSTRIPQKTVLQARRLTDGRSVWTFTGAALIPHRPAAAGADFLGVPTFVDGELWGLAQCDSALLAYRLNREDGCLLGVLKVGETTRGQVVDSDWRSLANQVATTSCELVFVTNAGLLLAADPVSGTPLWATRYAREDAPPEYPQLVGAQINTSRRRWWDHWREGRVLSLGSADNAALGRIGMIVASTDSDDITALGHDGRLVWRQSIDDGVSVVGVRGDHLLVMTRHAALILSVATGAQIQTIPIPAPTGDGDWSVANPDAYWFPTARGIWSIELSKSPALATPVDDDGLTPGHLMVARSGLVHQTVDSVSLISAGVRLPNDGKSPPADVSENVDKLFATAQQARMAGDTEAAFKAYLRLLELNPTTWKSGDEIGPRRRVRLDRLALGEMQDLLYSEHAPGTASPARTPLKDLITAAHQQATVSPDPFALQRFAQRYGHLSPAREVWLHRSSRIGLGYVPTLLPILSLTEAEDSFLALRAAVEAAEHFRSRSYEDDARAILAKAPQLLAAAQAAEAAAPLEAIQQLRRTLSDEPKNFWPVTAPVVTEREMAQNNIAFKPLPVSAAAGSLLSRLDVSWHAAGTSLRFIGDGRAGGWSLTLPQTRAFMRRADRLAHGWGVGHLLVAQLGTELFAVAPFDENGDARARLLWSIDMAPAAQMHGHRVIPAKLGFGDQDLQLLDAYDRPIGQVGPVQAGYLCYQAEGRLVCLDTASGQTLWERFELPHNATITGNEAAIFVTADDSTTVLRALDGKMLRASQSAEHSESRLVDQSGPWQVRRTDDRLLGVDLRSGGVVWSRDLAAGDLTFAADQEHLGLLSANGELIFLSRSSGESIRLTSTDEPPVRLNRPQRVEFLACVPIGSRYLVAVSGPRSHAGAETQFEALMTRNPLIDGTVTSVDRKTGKIQWSQEIAEGAFLLDQPRSVPFVLLQSTSAERGGTFLRLIDQRTGIELFRRHTPGREGLPLIRPNSPQPSVSLRSATREIIVDYAP